MDRLSHISFETTNAEQMRAYLASRGVKVPEKLEPMQDGNRGFDVIDPDGHDVEFVEFVPGSLHSRNFGKFLPDTRISPRIIHVGVVVKDRAAADRFYRDILGFKLQWQGGMKDTDTDWVAEACRSTADLQDNRLALIVDLIWVIPRAACGLFRLFPGGRQGERSGDSTPCVYGLGRAGPLPAGRPAAWAAVASKPWIRWRADIAPDEAIPYCL